MRPTLIGLPNTVHSFISWPRNAIFDMESSDLMNFPDNPIKFTRKCYSLLNKRQVQKLNGVECVSTLIEVLGNLQVLRNNFCVYLPLSDALQVSKNKTHQNTVCNNHNCFDTVHSSKSGD